MNKHVLALLAALAFATTGPVLAVDAQTPPVPARPGDASSPSPAPRCPVEPLVLPLDHGPRAQSTPYLNRLRAERHAAQVRACAGVAK